MVKERNEVNKYSYKERLSLNTNAKKKIVEKVKLFIHNAGRYFFDVSSNIQFLANALNKKY